MFPIRNRPLIGKLSPLSHALRQQPHLDRMFSFCSYIASPDPDAEMDNRINEIRKVIKALRVSILEAEAVMRDQITRDQDCTFVAQELLKMRAVMSGLVREKETLGDHAPILVNTHV